MATLQKGAGDAPQLVGLRKPPAVFGAEGVSLEMVVLDSRKGEDAAAARPTLQHKDRLARGGAHSSTRI